MATSILKRVVAFTLIELWITTPALDALAAARAAGPVQVSTEHSTRPAEPSPSAQPASALPEAKRRAPKIRPPVSKHTTPRPLVPLLPASVTLPAKGPSAGNVWALFDGRARSGPQAISSAPLELRVSFGAQRRLEEIAVYGSSDGHLTVYTESAEGRRAIDGWTELDLSNLAERWVRFAAKEGVSAESLSLVWTPSGQRGLRELEFWGEGPLPIAPAETEVADSILSGNVLGAAQGSAVLHETEVTRVGGARTLEVNLASSPEALSRAFLVYELRGLGHWLSPVRRINGGEALGGGSAPAADGGLQVEEISPRWLRKGSNSIEFLPVSAWEGPGYRVRNVRLVGVSGAGTHEARVVSQRIGEAEPQGPERFQLGFDRPSEPHSLAFELLEPSSGKLQVTGSSSPARHRQLVDLVGLSPGMHRVELDPALGPSSGLTFTLNTKPAPATGASRPSVALSRLLVTASAVPLESERRLAISFPLHGECRDGRALVRGFVEGHDAAAAELRVTSSRRQSRLGRDGSFEVELAAPQTSGGRSWHAKVEARFLDGEKLVSFVELGPCPAEPNESRPEGEQLVDDGAPFGALVLPNQAATLSFAGASLEIPKGAVSEATRVTIRPLVGDQVRSMDRSMQNVVPGGRAFRFGPHGLKFKKPVKVTLPYDAAKIPEGLSLRDVHDFYFDEEARKWIKIGRFDETQPGRLTGLTEHFTDFVSATLAMPDSPGGKAFHSNELKDIELGSPSSGVDLIEPPEPTSSGILSLKHAIDVPPGRNGVHPELALSYNSDAANGWLGQGWDLSLSSIEIDTRFGVPRYSGSEDYLLDGQALTPISGGSLYRRRVEGAFDRIERLGDGPSTYSWVVTDDRGTRSFYGSSSNARLADPSGDPTLHGRIARWYLERVEDTFGNAMTVSYRRDQGNNGEPFVQVYPLRIDYASHVASGLQAAYHVDFVLNRTPGTAPSRPDVIIGGRTGFQVLTRYLLDRIDVRLGDTEVIRSYALDYTTGDFSKTLLETVGLHGVGTRAASGAVTLGGRLYEHRLDYFDATPGLFAEPAIWGQAQIPGGARSADGLSRSEDSAAGGGGEVGVGIGPISFTVGGGGYSGDDDILLSLFDLTGDGLAELIDSQGRVSHNLLRQPTSGHVGFLDLFEAPGSLSHTNRSGWHVKAGISFSVLGAGVRYTRSTTSDDRITADIDGDGRADLLSSGGGSVRARLSQGEDGFAPPAAFGAIVQGDFQRGPQELVDQAGDTLHPLDALLRWNAPFAGSVAISGALQKLEAGGDGVRAEIYHNDTLIWSRAVGPADLAACTPAPANGCNGGPLTRMLAAGDRLYTRLSNKQDPSPLVRGDDTFDEVLWNPTFSYGVSAAELELREPYGPRIFQFSQADDQRLAGRPELPFVASAAGEVVLEGTLAKLPTSDEVRIEVFQENALGIRIRDIIPSTVLGAGFDSLTMPTTSFHVDAGNSIRVRVLSDIAIDPARVLWQPLIRYQNFCRLNPDTQAFVCGDVTCSLRADGNVGCNIDNDPTPEVPIPLDVIAHQAQVFSPTFQTLPLTPTETFVVSGGSTASVTGLVQKVAATANPVVVVVQGVHALHFKQVLAPGFVGALPLSISGLPVQAGEQLFFTIFSESDVTGVVSGAIAVNGAPAQFNVRFRDASFDAEVNPFTHEPADPFSGGYHRFFVGQWNGNEDFAEALLTFPESSGINPFYFMVPRRQGLPDLEQPLWVSTNSDGYIAAGRQKPSRVGRFARLRQGASGGDIEDLRSSETWNVEFDVQVGPVDAAYNTGATTTDLDFFDFNGDRLPDSVTSNGVVFNTGTGFDAKQPVGFGFDELRRVEHRSARAGVGVERSLINQTDSQGRSKSLLSTGFNVGIDYGYSASHVELADVNGDGLPDHIRKRPSDGAVLVRLNLGYRFGETIAWANTGWSRDATVTGGGIESFVDNVMGEIVTTFSDDVGPNVVRLQDTGGKSVGVSVGAAGIGGGGGYTYTVSRSFVDLVDINGDGLPDQLMKMPDEATTLRVKLNLGDRFGPEQQLSIPNWGDISGFDPPSYTFSGGADALGFRRSQTFTGSVSAKVCFIVCVGGNGFYSEGSGWSQLEFDDIDGDGKVDHVLKLDGNANVYAKLNQIGKSNLLRSVTRPLGGSFEVDYRRAGNLVDPASSTQQPRVDMPSNQWVLAKVAISDGGGNVYSRQFLYGDDDRLVGGEQDPSDRDQGFFDRVEREGYGYATVITIREDQSRVVDRHHNQDYYRKGLLHDSAEVDSAGNLFTRQVLVQRDPSSAVLAPGESTAVRSGTFFPAETDRESLFYEGATSDPNAPGKRSAEHRVWNLVEGDLEQFREDGDDGPEDDLVYTIAYHEEPTLNIRKPSLVEGRDLSGNLLRKRAASYFAGTGALQTLTNVVIGGINPLTGTPYVDSPTSNSTWSFAYDEFGNLQSTTDPRGFVLSYDYDDLTESFRTSVVDSFGYTSTTQPNYLFGTVAEVVDVNGHAVEYHFDDFGRLSQVFGPNDNAEPSLRFDYGLQPDVAAPFPAWARTQHLDRFHPGDPIVTVTFADGIDRIIQTKKDIERDDGSGAPPSVGMTVSGAISYDERGRVHRQGQPTFETVSPESHLEDSSATVFSSVPQLNPSEFQYDILSRDRRLITPDDTSPDPSVTTTDYGFGTLDGVSTLATTVTDPNGHVRITHRDVDEAIVGVVEFNRLRNEVGSTELVTRYDYNALDELVRVEDALGNVTTAAYDTVGRMVALTSPDMGRTEWRYDRSGNLAAKQSARLRAKNQLIVYEYDFNRVRRINYPESADVSYTYGGPELAGDASFNRASRIVEESSEAGAKVYEYDRLGNVTRLESVFQRIRTPNKPPYTYALEYEYDTFGRLVQLVFPGASREVVSYGYDRGGLVKSARGELTGTPPQHAPELTTYDYFTHIGYDEYEKRVRLVHGNGVQTNYAYYERTRRLREINADHRDPRLVQSGLPGRPFQRLRYAYDRVGNILEIRNDAPFDDTMQPKVLTATTTQSFGYDDLYQLRTADGIYQDRSQWRHRYSLAFEYDEISRILLKDQASFRDLPNPPGEWTPDHPDQDQTYRASYQYAGAQPHAPSRIDEQILNGQVRPRRFSYDESGNQTGWVYHQNKRRTIEWDEEDRVHEIKEQGQRLTRALYDGEGKRAVHVGYHGQEETAYLGENLTIRNGVYPSKHIYAGNDLVASKLDPEWFPHPPTLYYHSDHLGSAQFASNDEQELTQHDEFFPTGELWQSQTEGRYSNRRVTRFTGKELDPGANLYYFGARWYDPRQSQWISPDPILARYMEGEFGRGVYAPGSLGLYSYARNNPVAFRDSDGNIIWFVAIAVAAGVLLQSEAANAPRPGEATIPRNPPHVQAQQMAQRSLALATPLKTGIGMAIEAGKEELIEQANKIDPSGKLATGVEAAATVASMKAGPKGSAKVKVQAKAGKAPGAKRGPKTDPNAPHNATIRQEADKLEAEGNKILAGGGRKKEKLIPTPGGKKSGRRPDILYETPSGQVKGRNVGKTKAGGEAATREQDALEDLNEKGGVPTDFVPYDKPPKQ
ncbi:MAG TPA: SpvB/TcaC N-terminal domain-containing protein [Polyangiaceae bacterium]|nr:SpvB/TcaC N-terminal domain-containing protein [Polyangiaceae bacterium]